jgi:hypothetical protein
MYSFRVVPPGSFILIIPAFAINVNAGSFICPGGTFPLPSFFLLPYATRATLFPYRIYTARIVPSLTDPKGGSFEKTHYRAANLLHDRWCRFRASF